MQHPMLPRAWGEQPHKTKPQHPKNLCASFPNILSCFFNVFCTFFMPVRAQFGIKRPAFTWGHGGDAGPHIRRLFTNVRKSCAKRTMGVALPLPGCGGGISPHMKAFLHCFLKLSPQDFMPARAQFGIKRPAFTRGYGGDASPHIRTASPAKPRSLYAQKGITWDATFYVAGGVGRAAPQNKSPTSKNLCASFQNISSCFSKENGRVCARPLKEVLCKKAVIPAFPRRASWAFPDKRVFALLQWHRPSC